MTKFSIVYGGQPGCAVLISGFGDRDTGGGLFSFDGATVHRIDSISSTGLAFNGQQLLRALRGTGPNSPGELVTYDARGVQHYARVDELHDPHDVAWDGAQILAVSAEGNSVLWLSPYGAVTQVWTAPGVGDAWHLNGLLVHNHSLYVSAFGRYREHREWERRLRQGDGIIFDLATRKNIATGLCAPHSPKYFDGHLVICSSANNMLLQIEASSGCVVRKVALNSWTRGVAHCDDFVLVGESGARQSDSGLASLVVLSRRNWEVLGRYRLPCREIYDLVVVPPVMVESVRTGFRTNSSRIIEQDQLCLFEQLGIRPSLLWATGDPLRPTDCRISIEADIPARLVADRLVEIKIKVKNLGDKILTSAPPHPVLLSYQWLQGEQEVERQGLRTVLPRSLPPQETAEGSMSVRVPASPGTFILRLTLLQEGVVWFHEAAHDNCCCGNVEVIPDLEPAISVEEEISVRGAVPNKSGNRDTARSTCSLLRGLLHRD